jgi:hypothetical protein
MLGKQTTFYIREKTRDNQDAMRRTRSVRSEFSGGRMVVLDRKVVAGQVGRTPLLTYMAGLLRQVHQHFEHETIQRGT